MIKRITKKIVLEYEDRVIDLPDELRQAIDTFWQKAVQENPALYNGDDYAVESVEETENEIIMHVVKSNYAHYLYNERVGISELKYRCIAPWSGLLLLTNDGYWVVGQMAKTTSFAGGFQIPGGGVDKKDIKDNRIDMYENLKREVKEEVNLDLDKINFEFEFLECPMGKRNVYGFLAIGKLDMSKEELKKHFDEYQKYLIENGLEIEFEKLIFFTKGNSIQEYDTYDNPKRPYMRELLEEAEDIIKEV